MNPFQGKIIILSFGLVVGGIACSLISLLLLFAKKTIKKYAVFSGGFVALDGCTNAKVRSFRHVNTFQIALSIAEFINYVYYGSVMVWRISPCDLCRGG